MRITAEQLLLIADSAVLTRLAVQEMQPLAAYRLARLRAVVELEAIRVQQARNALITPEISIEENGVRRVRPDQMAVFQAAVSPLLAEEIELPIKPLTFDDLTGVKISPEGIRALGPLLTEPQA